MAYRCDFYDGCCFIGGGCSMWQKTKGRKMVKNIRKMVENIRKMVFFGTCRSGKMVMKAL